MYKHHLIFEGPELAGKSYLMHGIYDFLEAKYNENRAVLDGCHWFNCDVGVFGTRYGGFCIEKYIEIMEKMKEKNILFEKFHISDIVYQRLNNKVEISYADIEKRLNELKAKIIFCSIKPDVSLLEIRIKDRIKLYPHYERILRDPKWYLIQLEEYRKEIKKSKLPVFEVDMSEIPNEKGNEILKWIGEI